MPREAAVLCHSTPRECPLPLLVVAYEQFAFEAPRLFGIEFNHGPQPSTWPLALPKVLPCLRLNSLAISSAGRESR